MTGRDDARALAFARRHAAPLALAAILALGFQLRAYHIDYPSIGYHNMKENEYLSMAVNYHEKGLLANKEVFFYGHEEIPHFDDYFQVPLISYAAVLAWKILGVSVWSVRLQMILFSLGGIVVSYLLTRALTRDTTVALLTAAALSLLPVHVFFGRNIQPETPALFFLLTFFWLFLRWKDSFSPTHSTLAGLAWVCIGLYKASFLVPTLAVLAWRPWQRPAATAGARRWTPWLGFTSALILPVWILIDASLTPDAADYVSRRIKPFQSLHVEYWRQLLATGYLSENFTAWLGAVSLGGLALLLSRRAEARGFILLWLASLLPYMLLFSDHVNQHSYYQMPYLFPVAFCIAHGLASLFGFAARLTRLPALRLGGFVVLALCIGPVKEQLGRLFDTQFLGLDVAGRFIQEHTGPSERFLRRGSSQMEGVCYFARRYCMDLPDDPREVLDFERRYGSRFVYVGPGYMHEVRRSESWSYVSSHYGIVHAGLIPIDGELSVIHVVLEKGQGLRLKELSKHEPVLVKEYELTTGTVPFYVIEPS
jgi:hypothetical protein